MRISDLQPNPDNPRHIYEEDVLKGAKSIFLFSAMLRYRPIVYDPEGMFPIGGNVRLLAIKLLFEKLQKIILPKADEKTFHTAISSTYKKIFGKTYKLSAPDGPAQLEALRTSWVDILAITNGEFPAGSVVSASELTAEQRLEFMVKDNGSLGRWNYDALSNFYDALQLSEWGVEVPGVTFGTKEDPPEVVENPDADEEEPAASKWVPDCIFESNNEFDIPTLRLDGQAESLINPVAPWGYSARDAKNIGTYHFYVDDYRFSKIWDTPNQLVYSGAQRVIEPNLSLYDQTPKGYALFLIYKKRWIARYWQSFGVKVFVDLNVSHKFQEENLIGVPKGWNAYATRGYSGRLELLESEYELAKKHSGREDPYFVVYGGGKDVKDWAMDKNVIFLTQIMADKFK